MRAHCLRQEEHAEDVGLERAPQLLLGNVGYVLVGMLFAGIVYEDAAEKHGLGAEQATLFGAGYPGLADIVTAVLWSTMADRFPSIARLLPEHAPRVDALTQRMQAVPSLARLASDSREVYGDAYCGGQIERSLREVAC